MPEYLYFKIIPEAAQFIPKYDDSLKSLFTKSGTNPTKLLSNIPHYFASL